MTHDMTAVMAKTRRESIRWFLLVALNVARPVGAKVPMLRSVIQASYEDATEKEIERELDYLADRDLVLIERPPQGAWHCELKRYGVDVVEYTVECEPGIARPKQG